MIDELPVEDRLLEADTDDDAEELALVVVVSETLLVDGRGRPTASTVALLILNVTLCANGAVAPVS